MNNIVHNIFTLLEFASVQNNMCVYVNFSRCLWSEFDTLMMVVVSYVPVELSPKCLLM